MKGHWIEINWLINGILHCNEVVDWRNRMRRLKVSNAAGKIFQKDGWLAFFIFYFLFCFAWKKFSKMIEGGRVSCWFFIFLFFCCKIFFSFFLWCTIDMLILFLTAFYFWHSFQELCLRGEHCSIEFLLENKRPMICTVFNNRIYNKIRMSGR